VLQAVVQEWLVGSQLEPLGQSFGLMQPHAPPPTAGTQLVPRLLIAQSTHAPPELPHAPAVLPS
jgi:hypothetical protein